MLFRCEKRSTKAAFALRQGDSRNSMSAFLSTFSWTLLVPCWKACRCYRRNLMHLYSGRSQVLKKVRYIRCPASSDLTYCRVYFHRVCIRAFPLNEKKSHVYRLTETCVSAFSNKAIRFNVEWNIALFVSIFKGFKYSHTPSCNSTSVPQRKSSQRTKGNHFLNEQE